MPDDRKSFTVRRYAIPRASPHGQAEPLSGDAVRVLLMEHQRREVDAFWSGILGATMGGPSGHTRGHPERRKAATIED